jgi:hypothetical protein
VRPYQKNPTLSSAPAFRRRVHAAAFILIRARAGAACRDWGSVFIPLFLALSMAVCCAGCAAVQGGHPADDESQPRAVRRTANAIPLIEVSWRRCPARPGPPPVADAPCAERRCCARQVALLPLPRTNRTSLVPPLVLSGHAASLTPYRWRCSSFSSASSPNTSTAPRPRASPP